MGMLRESRGIGGVTQVLSWVGVPGMDTNIRLICLHQLGMSDLLLRKDW